MAFFCLGFLTRLPYSPAESPQLLSIPETLQNARVLRCHTYPIPATTVEAFAEDLEATPFCRESFHTSCQPVGLANSKSAHFERGTAYFDFKGC